MQIQLLLLSRVTLVYRTKQKIKRMRTESARGMENDHLVGGVGRHTTYAYPLICTLKSDSVEP